MADSRRVQLVLVTKQPLEMAHMRNGLQRDCVESYRLRCRSVGVRDEGECAAGASAIRACEREYSEEYFGGTTIHEAWSASVLLVAGDNVTVRCCRGSVVKGCTY